MNVDNELPSLETERLIRRPLSMGDLEFVFRHFSDPEGNRLEKASWRQGIMTEALRAMLRYGFEQMELNRVEALVHIENDASIHLLERLGFQKEGLLRQYFRRGDTYYDHWLLSLLKAEWTTS